MICLIRCSRILRKVHEINPWRFIFKWCWLMLQYKFSSTCPIFIMRYKIPIIRYYYSWDKPKDYILYISKTNISSVTVEYYYQNARLYCQKCLEVILQFSLLKIFSSYWEKFMDSSIKNERYGLSLIIISLE
jgi:hypothetical protein